MICDGKHYMLKYWPGLQFNLENGNKEEFEFNEVPGLKEAGWS
jgi:hypothetical protein